VRRKGTALIALLVAIAVVAAVALAARGGSDTAKPPAFQPPDASKQYGDDADLMRRLERKKLTTRTTR